MKPKHKLSLKHLNTVTISNLSNLESAHILGGAVTVCLCTGSPSEDPPPTGDLGRMEGDPDVGGDGLG
jgi:hypothetical protein